LHASTPALWWDSKTELWPANHKYVTVNASFVTSSDTASVTLLSVTSNEPDNGLGDGDFPNDILIVDNDTVKLRAERSALGEGRTYTFTYLWSSQSRLTD